MTDTDLAEALRALAGRITELNELTRGNLVNHVLYSGTVVVGAAGYVSIDFAIPMASVMIQASGTFGYVTVAAAPPASSAPTSGAGVVAVGPDAMLSVPLTGTVLTVYGTAGDLVYLGVWSRAQPPAGA